MIPAPIMATILPRFLRTSLFDDNARTEWLGMLFI